MSTVPQVTLADVDNLTKKLSEFASTLNESERKVLAGALELAGKMYEGTGSPSPKKTLSLTRESVRDLNLWERLLETQGHSLWTCDRPPILGDDIINPSK